MSTLTKLMLVAALSIAATGAPWAAASTATTGVTPTFKHIGKLAFGPDGILFAADAQEVSINALQLAKQMAGGAAGTKDIPAIDQKIAGLLGIDASNLIISDMLVHPKTRNTFISAMRGTGAGATAVLLRVDGAGKIDVVSFDQVRYSKIGLPSPPPAETPLLLANGQKFPVNNYPDRFDPKGLMGIQTITHMAFIDGNLYVSGLSGEEFASKMRVIPYPFATADSGTSVEIYHGAHGQFETFSPVFTFVPYRINGEPNIIASYLCTPLVKFPVAALKPGSKIRGTTIAELGNRNRPIDMILYKKDGREFLLMSNTNRGVMKIPTDTFGTAPAITSPVAEKAGVGYETIASMQGVEQLDMLDASQTLVLARSDGALNLSTVPLP
jgi:hypothetical protein